MNLKKIAKKIVAVTGALAVIGGYLTTFSVCTHASEIITSKIVIVTPQVKCSIPPDGIIKPCVVASIPPDGSPIIK